MNWKLELSRKAIHVGFGAVPFAYFLGVERSALLTVVGAATIAFLVAEFLRLRSGFVKVMFHRWFGGMIRDREQTTLTAASYSLVSAFLVILIFERSVAVFSLFVLTLADPAAALAGMRFGKPIGHSTKTAVGSLAFLVVSLALALWLPDLSRWPAVAAALATTAAEALPSNVNDNLLVPLTAAAAVTFGQFLQ